MVPLSSLPQVEKLLEHAKVAAWNPILSRPLVARIVSQTLEVVRTSLREGSSRDSAVSEDRIVEPVVESCRRLARRRIGKVINATGVALHTNLGRAPLPASVWSAAAPANTGYSNIEIDLETGARGKRNGIIPELLAILTGCEEALVVNNNAGALLLILTALARGKQVVVSRGEQVQIGGGFRIPEILALSGAELVEVGTTNITTLQDYLGAVTDATAMALIVHPSNFRIRGFTEKPQLSELARSLPAHVVLAVDQGSGTTTEEIPGETRVRSYLKQGARLVCCSADKVLGGPQAGLILGDRQLVATLSSHSLLRALRPGKTIYSLLEGHLVQRLNGMVQGQAERVLGAPRAALEALGARLLAGIPASRAALVPSEAASGGGSGPDEAVESLSIELRTTERPEETLARLRRLPTPVIATIVRDRVRLNLATMIGEDERYLSDSIRAVLAE